MSADKVLSQEEIDAMLSGGSSAGEEAASEEAEKPAAPVAVQEPPPQPVDSPPPAVVQEPSPEPVAPPPPAVVQEPPPQPVDSPPPAVVQEPSPEPVAPPPPAVAAAPQPPPVAVPSAQLSAGDTQQMLTNMMERLDTMGAAIERISQLERAVIESNTAVRQTRQDMLNLANQVQLVSSKVDGILSNLKATIGYRAQKTFTCSSCKTSGNVATRVRCTQCGEENWWGWWPQQEK